MPIPLASAAKMLCKEYQNLQKEPVEGFCIVKVDESDLYEWIVAIFGPPQTLYEGGYFNYHPFPRGLPLLSTNLSLPFKNVAPQHLRKRRSLYFYFAPTQQYNPRR